MNREVIKANKEAFDWWLNGGNIVILEPGETEWSICSYIKWAYSDIKYVINDEYVEFRKALAEGKAVEVKYVHPRNSLRDKWIPTQRIMKNHPHRLKPDEVNEPKFKVGDWVRNKNNGHITKVVDSDFPIGTILDFEPWQPKEGDVVVCWHTGMYRRIIGQVCKGLYGLHLEGYTTDNLEDYGNIVPYIGQSFEEMK